MAEETGTGVTSGVGVGGDAGVACLTLGIVDNDPFVLKLLDELFRRSGAPISVVWSVRNGADALTMCDRSSTRPQAVLTDLSMPDMDGMQLSGVLHVRHPAIAVIAMTAFEVGHTDEEMRSAGIASIVIKGCSTSKMVRVIGKAVGNAICAHWDERRIRVSSSCLTGTEVEILRLYVNGRTTAAVANQLGRSEGTVKSHLRTIYRKIGVNCRAEALRYCMEQGLL